MKSIDEAYIGLDLHASRSVFGVKDSHGKSICKQTLQTDPKLMRRWLKRLPARRKYLAVEEGPLTQWMSWQLADVVDEVFVCDPKENFLISRSPRKTDQVDAFALARLLRLGELHRVWHPGQPNKRALFAAAAAHYMKMRKHQVRLKQQIKGIYRRWGVLRVEGEAVYGPEGRGDYLEQVSEQIIYQQLCSYYAMMDQAVHAQQVAEQRLYQMGKAYPEITEFQKAPGIGRIGAHLFDAIVQTPHRFASIAKLWRWGQLGITDRSSNGKPLGYERLDPSGRSEIKQISYRAWKAGALQATEPNELQRYYEKSLKGTTRTHARLNTQRKIIHVLWTIWRKQQQYKPELF